MTMNLQLISSDVLIEVRFVYVYSCVTMYSGGGVLQE